MKPTNYKSNYLTEILKLSFYNDNRGIVNIKDFQQPSQQKFAVSPIIKILALSAIVVIAVYALIMITCSKGDRVDNNLSPSPTSNYNFIFRRWKRDLLPILKNNSNEIIFKLESFESCKNECAKIRENLNKLETGTMKLYEDFRNLRFEIEDLIYNCVNKIGLNVDLDRKAEINTSENTFSEHKFYKKDDILERKEMNKLFTSNDNEYSSSNIKPHYVKAPLNGTEHEDLPPTGPGASVSSIRDSIFITAPGEALKTGHQLTVSLPERVQKICYISPTKLGASSQNMIVCTPYDQIASNIPPVGQRLPDNFYVPSLYGARESQQSWPTEFGKPQQFLHVPTAVSSQNPYYFPTLGGAPIITPANSPPYYAQGQYSQVYPIYNTQTGVISLQNIPSTTQIFKQPVIYPPVPYNYPMFAGSIQPIVALPQQFNRNMYCTYVPLPNAPTQVYKFPTVEGVSEIIQRSEAEDVDQELTVKVKKIDYHKNKSIIYEKMMREDICEYGEIVCRDGVTCVPYSNWCDGTVHCPDLSDEIHCPCKYRINKDKFCDGYFDCPDGEDEQECFACPKDTFSCDDWNGEEPTVTCVHVMKRCDGVRNCPNGKDEHDCSIITNYVGQLSNPVVSYGEGYLHRNWKGKWHPVCAHEIFHIWGQEGCDSEFGKFNSKSEIRLQPLPETYNGPFIGIDAHGRTMFLSNCPGGLTTWVSCKQIKCGIRTLSSRLDSELTDRNKRYSNMDKNNLAEVVSLNGQNYLHICKTNDESSSNYNPYKHYRTYPNMQFHTANSKNGYYNQAQYYRQTDNNQMGRANILPSLNPNIENSDLYRRWWGALLEPFMGYYNQDRPSNNKNDIFLNEKSQSRSSSLDRYSPYFTKNIRTKRKATTDYEDREKIREIRDDVSGRIVGGEKSKPGAWPWLIALSKDGVFHCGGVILSETTIITAAHCIVGFERHYFEASAGMLRRFSFSPQEQIRKVVKIIMHEEYDKTDFRNDIALLKVDKGFIYNRWVLPICLSGDPHVPRPGTKCTAVGWGATYEHGLDPDHLHDVEIPVQTNCKYHGDRASGDICAGYHEGGKDTCQGDSGGPLLCKLDKNDHWYLAGIVSHGKGCARFNEPGVYTRVALYLDWINSSLDQEKSIGNSPKEECPGLQCDGGKCIPSSKKCNGVLNCLKGDDELVCKGAVVFIGRSEKIGNTNRSETISEEYQQQNNESNIETISEPSISRFSSTIDNNNIKMENYNTTLTQEPPTIASQSFEKSLIIQFVGIKQNVTGTARSETLPSESYISEIVNNNSNTTESLENTLDKIAEDLTDYYNPVSNASSHPVEKSLTLEFIGETKINETFPENMTSLSLISTVSEMDELSTIIYESEVTKDKSIDKVTAYRNTSEEQPTSGFDVNNFSKELITTDALAGVTEPFSEAAKILNIEVLTSSEQFAENISEVMIDSNEDLKKVTTKNYHILPHNYSVTKISDVENNFSSNRPDLDKPENLNFNDHFSKLNDTTVQEEISRSSQGLISTTEMFNISSSKNIQEYNSEAAKIKILNIEVLTSSEQFAENISEVMIDSNEDLKKVTTKNYHILPHNYSVTKISDVENNFRSSMADNNNGNQESYISTVSMQESMITLPQNNFSYTAELSINTSEPISIMDHAVSLDGTTVSTSKLVTESKMFPEAPTVDSISHISALNNITHEENSFQQTVTTESLYGIKSDVEVSTVVGTSESDTNILVSQEIVNKTPMETPAFSVTSTDSSVDINGSSAANKIVLQDSTVEEVSFSPVYDTSTPEDRKVTLPQTAPSLVTSMNVSTDSVDQNSSLHPVIDEYEIVNSTTLQVSTISLQTITEAASKFQESSQALEKLEIDSHSSELNNITIEEGKKLPDHKNTDGVTLNSTPRIEPYNQTVFTDNNYTEFYSTERYNNIGTLDSQTNINLNETTSYNMEVGATDSTEFSTTISYFSVSEIPRTLSIPLNKSDPVNFNQLTISQTESMDISELFKCASFKQSIMKSEYCDGILDCIDGSDEQNCTCGNKLANILPQKICDSVIDCADGSDEYNCPKQCEADQFYCGKSKFCIPVNNRCDGISHCAFHEDEIDCYALSDGKTVKLDQGGRPELLNKGVAVHFQNNHWRSFCLNDKMEILSEAMKICKRLGFSEAVDYSDIKIANSTFTQISSSIFHNDTSTSQPCRGLFLQCSQTLERTTPWLTNVYIEGKLKTLGVLLTDSWVVVSSTSFVNINVEEAYIIASLGTGNETLDNNIIGPYEQNIAIDNVTAVPNSLITLLHLNMPIVLNHKIIPIGINKWSSTDEYCEAMVLKSERIIFIPLQEDKDNCEQDKRCFKIFTIPNYCWEGKIEEANGHVVCHSNYGVYLAAVFNEKDSFCIKDCFVKFDDFYAKNKEIITITSSSSVRVYDIPLCDSMRCSHGNCLDWQFIYDGVHQCIDGSDETEFMRKKKNDYCKKHNNCTCGPNMFRCASGECLPLKRYCDGNDDCKDSSDEDGACSNSCSYFLNATLPQYLCDGRQNCLQKEDEDWDLCEGKYDCDDKELYYMCENSDQCIPKDFVCDGDVDCPNEEDEHYCLGIDYFISTDYKGRFMTQSYGQWYAVCVTSPVDSDVNDEICSLLGYQTVKNASYEIINKTIVTLDPFSSVTIGPNVQFAIRSSRPPFVLEKNGTCNSLFIECE